MTTPVLGYVDRQGPLHRINGAAKLIFVIGMMIAAVISFDARFLIAQGLLSAVLWALSRVKLRDLAIVLGFIAVFMVLNNILIYVFAPQYGTEIFGTRHVIWQGPGRWVLTEEQLMYQFVVTLKYFAMLPSVLLFITTTRPPEFASSLHRIGVPYRVSYSVSLALRYIPEVQRDFRTISQAQQARGMDTSRKVSFGTRLRNITAALMPLLLGTFDRIESVATAMELRGFGRGRSRTWYTRRPLQAGDVIVIVMAGLIVAISVALVWVNGGRFWNPFTS